VGNPVLAGEDPVGRVGVADQQRVRIKLRQQVLRQLGRRQWAAASDGIDRLDAAIARHQDAVEFARDATPPCAAAPFARRPVGLARPFLRFERENLAGRVTSCHILQWRSAGVQTNVSFPVHHCRCYPIYKLIWRWCPRQNLTQTWTLKICNTAAVARARQ